MTSATKKFTVTYTGHDEYPGDGLRISDGVNCYKKDFLNEMLKVEANDEIEITVKLISRLVTKRELVE